VISLTDDDRAGNGTLFRDTFRSLKYRNYRLFFSGQSVSLIGTWMQRIAIPWFVYSMTDSALLLGIVAFASYIPTFLLAPIAGAIIDRWDRYKVLVISQVLLMLQAFSLAALYFTGTAEVWNVIMLTVLMGAINAFDLPARHSFVIDMVEGGKDLNNAIALNSVMFNAARLVGPSIAGMIILVSNEGICFLLNGISFLFVITSLLMMRIGPRTSLVKRKDVWSEMKEGFSYAFRFPPVRDIIILLALMNLMGVPYIILLPVFASTVLGGGSTIYGFLMGATGVGALVATLYLASRKSPDGLVRMIAVSSALFGLAIIVFSLTRAFALSMAMVFFVGLWMMMNNTSTNTVLQTISDDDKRGRVMSFYAMAMMGATPIGSLLLGALADRIGAPLALAIGGFMCVIGALVFAWRLPSLLISIRPAFRRFHARSDDGV
jgi:MFS family permease